MSQDNRLSRIAARLAALPRPARIAAQSLLLGQIVPLVGTARIRFEELDPARVEVVVANRRRNRNHIGQVHAAAMALAVETATGIVVGMNVPDSRLPLLKSMKIDYVRRSSGDLRAVATLDDDQRQQIRDQERGNVTVEVTATDDSGEQPIRCEIVWAWVPRNK